MKIELGMLEVDPRGPEDSVSDGVYLLFAFAEIFGNQSGVVRALRDLPLTTNVKEAQKVSRGMTISCNYLFADIYGNIGYQQTGTLPDRHPDSIGLFPIPGWTKEFVWAGVVPPEHLESIYNPPSGYLATANNHIQKKNGPPAITAHMGSARLFRIGEMIENLEKK